ncbi:MAG: glycosyltransferase [Planctomycetaceae bacterium]|nr:glycosyltransferase [Planctomycetaceae bacterium]
MSPSVLIICARFPPVNVSSIHRTVALCRHLIAAGHRTTVLTMPPLNGQLVDPTLLSRVPGAVEIVAVRPWLQKWITNEGKRAAGPEQATASKPAAESDLPPSLRSWASWWLRTPDKWTPWLAPALRRILRYARTNRLDVIYSTAPVWTAHLVAMAAAARLKLPWVADCRDPWHANPFRRFPHAAHRRLDAALERHMVNRAWRVICNTQGAADDFARRFPDRAGSFVAIPNGYDADDVAAALAEPDRSDDGLCRLVHTGNFYGARSPRPLLAAMALLGRRRPDLRSRVRLVQIGLDSYQDQPLSDLARQCGAGDMIEVAGTMPHARALQAVRQADVAVVVGHDGPGSDLQIPRKFYEYIGLGKSVLVTGGSCAGITQLLAGRSRESIWMIPEQSDCGKLADAIEQIVVQWQGGRLAGREDLRTDFTSEVMAQRIRRVLVEAVMASAEPDMTAAGGELS